MGADNELGVGTRDQMAVAISVAEPDAIPSSSGFGPLRTAASSVEEL